MNHATACRRVLALMTTMLLFATGCGSSGNGGRNSSEVVVGVLENAAPFGAKNTSTGDYEGFEVDMAKYIVERAYEGKDVKFVGVGKDSRIPMLQGGDIDLLIATLTITEERKEVVDFSTPYFPSPVAVMVRRDSGINDVADLEGLTNCVPQGSAARQIFEQGGAMDPDLAPLMDTFDTTELPTPADCLLALRQGRGVDFVANDFATLGGQVANADDVELLDGVAIGEDLNLFGVALAKGHDEEMAEINDAVCRSFEDGTWNELYTKWIKVDPPAGWPKQC